MKPFSYNQLNLSLFLCVHDNKDKLNLVILRQL